MSIPEKDAPMTRDAMTMEQWAAAVAGLLNAASELCGGDAPLLTVLLLETLSTAIAASVRPGNFGSVIGRLQTDLCAMTRAKLLKLAAIPQPISSIH
jgi:hypothetical protein